MVLFVYGTARQGMGPDRVGRSIHLTFTWVAAAITCFLALAEGAVAVPAERAASTLPVLLTVPRTPRRLAVGFLLSRLLAALTLLLALLPLEGIALLLGGVSGADLLLSAAAVVGAGVYGAAVGFLGGHGAADHRKGLGRGVFLLIFLVALLPSLLGFLGFTLADGNGSAWRPGRWPETASDACSFAALALLACSPLGALLGVTSSGIPIQILPSPWAAVAIPGAASVVLALAAVLVAGRRLRLETESQVVAGGAGGFLRRLLPRRAPAAPGPALPWSPRVWNRPLLWKESRPPRNPFARWALRLAWAGYLALLAWLWFHPKVRHEFRGSGNGSSVYDFLISLPVWAMALGALVHSSTLVAEERERNSLDVLRATPIGPRQYILARPVGLLFRLAPMLAITAVFAGIGLFTGQVHAAALAAWAAGGALVIPFLAMAGFWRGMSAPTVRAATRRAGTLLALMVLVYPISLGLLGVATGTGDILLLYGLDPPVSLAGPYVLFAGLADDPTPDGEFVAFLVIAIGSAVGWAVIGWRLWSALPRRLLQALRSEGDG